VTPPEGLAQTKMQGAIAGTLLRRPGTPQNIAQAALFLIENDYVTGVCLPIDGGRTIG
jgi:pteridine reductase